jgi:hypothetical protein
MHEIRVTLTDLEWSALRGHHRDGLDMTDSQYIGLLLARERIRLIHEDERLRALRMALAEQKQQGI